MLLVIPQSPEATHGPVIAMWFLVNNGHTQAKWRWSATSAHAISRDADYRGLKTPAGQFLLLFDSLALQDDGSFLYPRAAIDSLVLA